MSGKSLEEFLQTADSPVEVLRGWGWGTFTELPAEYTNWIEEQKAWRDGVALLDLSYHMSDLHVEGPDAIDLYSDLAANNFEGTEPGKAKQLVICNPDGYQIGDAILFHLDEDEFLSVGPTSPHNWILYHVEKGDYDVDVDLLDRPVTLDRSPNYYRYQIQGPDALDVVEDATDEPIPKIPFFNFDELSIDGHSVNALRHGMAGERGFELFGPYEESDAIKQALLDAGEDYDIRRAGTKAYKSISAESAWIPLPVPAIYSGEEMKPYREWLSARRGTLSIGGSFDSKDIEDYYVRPTELGYGRFIDFDHDFIGKEALQEAAENPKRTKVTLVWDPDDVTDVFGSLVRDGPSKKYMDLPCPRWAACHYDEVLDGDDHVGMSMWTSYTSNDDAMLSLALVDTDYSDPGTEVSVRWGEPEWSRNPEVEPHEMTEIQATVAPAPYSERRT